MPGDIEVLFRTPIATVYDFTCRACPDSVSAPEYQTDFEIGFVRRGHFMLESGNRRRRVDSRSILLSNAGDELVFRHGRRVTDRCTVIRVPQKVLDDARSTYWQKESKVSGTDQLLPLSLIPTAPSLDYLHYRLFAHSRDASEWWQIGVESIAVAVVKEIFETMYGGCFEPPFDKPRDEHLESVERAKNFALAHLQEDVSLTDLAGKAHMSAFHFSRLFKRLTGSSPYRYLIEVRLHHAARLLKDSQATVTEVALESGFNGLSHFTSMFRTFYGTSPTDYRRR